MANGTRIDANTASPTDLTFNFTLNGADFAPYSVTKVEIYNDYNDAQNNVNIIETIDEANITIDDSKSRPGINSTIKYTAAILSTSASYFDKIYIVPRDGESTITFINTFFVKEENWGGVTPTTHEKVRIYVNLYDIVDNPKECSKITCTLNLGSAWYGNDFIKQEKEIFTADENGQVIMELVETDTMLKDTFDLIDPLHPTDDELRKIYYNVVIGNVKLLKIRVPKGTVQTSLKELPIIE